MQARPTQSPGTTLDRLYGSSLALLTDLYQLTMAHGYWRAGLAEREAVFHLFFRRAPFAGGYAIACGLDAVLDVVQRFRFSPDDLEYLATSSRATMARRCFRGPFSTCSARSSFAAATSMRSPRARRCSPTSRWCA